MKRKIVTKFDKELFKQVADMVRTKREECRHCPPEKCQCGKAVAEDVRQALSQGGDR
jgi:hypothetical protein